MPSLLSRMGIYQEQKTSIPQICSFVQLSAAEKPSKTLQFFLGYTQSGCWEITQNSFPG